MSNDQEPTLLTDTMETTPDDAPSVTTDSSVPAAAGVKAGQPAEAPEAPASPLTPQQIEELKAKAAQADEFRDRYLRVSADFDNFKKRSARERQEAVKFANESLLEKLIPTLDAFDMALAALGNAQGPTADSLKAGITMVHNQLRSVLAEAGLEEIDATGRPFDPRWHEAVSQQEAADRPEGEVLQQLRKGYKLRERLIRAALVIVARKPAP